MNSQYKRDFIQAGAIAREVRAYGKSLLQPGASYQEIIRRLQEKIHELGARPAFPPQIALNHIAAHFLTQPDEEIILSDQVVKLDIGVCCHGAIGDCATTVDLSGQHSKLIAAAEAALVAAEASLAVGQSVRDIGRIIETTITAYGFQPIRNLTGHGLGHYQIHTEPPIPNFDDRNAKGRIKPNMTFAIEPFATTGKGWIEERGEPTIFAQVGAGGREVRPELSAIMQKIGAFQRLPFAVHDLIDESMSAAYVRNALIQLCNTRIIAGYAPLVEVTKGIVAQAENSVLVDENGRVFITTR